MILDGEFTFRARRPSVWTLLQDPDVLVKAMPGAQRLVATGDGTYEGTIRIGVGPVTAATWTLTVALHDRQEPASYGMKVESKGPLGFTRGSASVELLDEPAGTRMKYRADMQIGGKVAGIGQRLLDQVARMLTKQGLEALSREMELRLSLAVGSTSASVGLATAPTVDGELVAADEGESHAATAPSGDDAAEANPESGEPVAAAGGTASADDAGAAVAEDAMEPGEDAATPGAPLAPGVPERAEPVADLDQELPPGTV
jgi:carbon monoxide dehydrogenase subunit G